MPDPSQIMRNLVTSLEDLRELVGDQRDEILRAVRDATGWSNTTSVYVHELHRALQELAGQVQFTTRLEPPVKNQVRRLLERAADDLMRHLQAEERATTDRQINDFRRGKIGQIL